MLANQDLLPESEIERVAHQVEFSKSNDSTPFPHEEHQYLDLIRLILINGKPRIDRTGTGTVSLFGHQLRFSLKDRTFPLLTTKRVFFKGVLEELLWFIKGDTNACNLAKRGVHIWDANGSVEFLAKRGLGHREAGDLGPVYGFQWRHFGAEYGDMQTDYQGKGVDQLAQVIESLKQDPFSRRHIVTAWNPVDLPSMALPPCHLLFQFYVSEDRDEKLGQMTKKLSCQMYQRSCDVGLGMPFNIASYSLLTIMVAHVVGMEPGEFVHVTGDTHVYQNHVEALKGQVEREPRPFPKLFIKRKVENIDDFMAEDFELVGYQPHEKISMKMAV